MVKALNLNFESHVFCRDGKCGKLAGLAVDPDVRRVTDLIVEEGILRRQARVIPWKTVLSATEDDVQLSCVREELEAFPEFQEIDLHNESDVPPDSEQIQAPITSEMAGYAHLHGASTPRDIREKIYVGISPDFALVKRGTDIKNADGTVGRLERVLVKPKSGIIKYFVMRPGFIAGEQRLLPISLVKHVTTKSIFVFASKEDVETLPAYTSDK